MKHFLLLGIILLIVAFVYVYKNQSTSSLPALSFSFLKENFTPSPNKLLSTDPNGNLSTITPNEVVSQAFAASIDDTNPTSIGLNNLSTLNTGSTGELIVNAPGNIWLRSKGVVSVSSDAQSSGNLLVDNDMTVKHDFVCNHWARVDGNMKVGELSIGDWKIGQDANGNLVFNNPKGTAGWLTQDGSMVMNKDVKAGGVMKAADQLLIKYNDRIALRGNGGTFLHATNSATNTNYSDWNSFDIMGA